MLNRTIFSKISEICRDLIIWMISLCNLFCYPTFFDFRVIRITSKTQKSHGYDTIIWNFCVFRKESNGRLTIQMILYFQRNFQIIQRLFFMNKDFWVSFSPKWNKTADFFGLKSKSYCQIHSKSGKWSVFPQKFSMILAFISGRRKSYLSSTFSLFMWRPNTKIILEGQTPSKIIIGKIRTRQLID